VRAGAALILSVFCLGFVSLRAQGDFSVRVSATEVPQHTVFEVSFHLNGGDGVDFRPPSFRGFEIVGGPSIGQATTVINGRMSYEMSWSYSLLARQQGQFTIEPASVRAGRKTLSTKPVNVRVGPPRASGDSEASGGEPILLRAETDGTEFYPGQQIVLRYRLFYRERVQSASTLAEDDYADFFVEPLSGHRWQTTLERVDDIEYTAQPVKVQALYAHQSGTYTIDPLILNVGIQGHNPGWPGMFSMFNTREVNVRSAPLQLRIRPLPGNAPATFSGAVGRYTFQIAADDRNLTTDQALTIRVRIEGEGDPKRWDPPAAIVTGPGEAYPPRIISDQPVQDDKGLTYRRDVEYQILPREAGAIAVVIPFTYFDPFETRYKTLGTDTLRFDIGQGVGRSLKEQAGTPGESLNDAGISITVKLLLSGGGILVLGLGLWYIARRRRTGSVAGQGPADAGQRALAALEVLATRPDEPERSAQATAIFLQYLEDRFGLTATDLEAGGLSAGMVRAGVPAEEQDAIIRLFHRCELVRYGGDAGRQAAATFLQSARDFLAGTIG